MNAKNRLIEKLLKAAKRHKILTYPVLALVAVISIFEYFFDWSTGAGKRVVAIIMVLVMLVSQSYFLTSSATEVLDTEEDVRTQQELQEQNTEKKQENSTDEPEEKTTELSANQDNGANDVSSEENSDWNDPAEAGLTTESGSSEEDLVSVTEESPERVTADESIRFIFLASTNTGTTVEILAGYATKNVDNATYTISSSSVSTANSGLAVYEEDGYYSCSGWYTDAACTKKVPDDGFDKLVPNVNNNIVLYSARTLNKYRVTIDTKGGTFERVDGATQNGVYYDVDVDEGAGTFQIVNPTREGYDIKGATVKNGTASVQTSGDSQTVIHVTLNGNNFEQTVTLDWEGEKYPVTYATSDKIDADTVTRQVQFDGESGRDILELSENIGVEHKPGYAFTAWKINGRSYEPGNLIKNYTGLQSYLYNHQDDVLIPESTYAGIKLDTTQITYQFMEKGEAYTVRGQYLDCDDAFDNAEYELVSIEADQTYTDASAFQSDYGIAIAAGGDGISVSTPGPKRVGSNIRVNVRITDLNADENDRTDTIYSFTISVTKNNLILKSDGIEEKLTKVYDGTTACPGITAGMEIPTNIRGVYVVVESGVYEDANAGKQKKIILKLASSNKYVFKDDELPPELQGIDNTNTDNYFTLMSTPEVLGEITRRPVYIRTSADKEQVKTGEANPNFEVTVRKDIGGADSNSGFINGDENRPITTYMDICASMSLSEEIGRDDYAQLEAGTPKIRYYVICRAKESSNYTFMWNTDNSDTGYFDVVMESPKENTNYEYVYTKEPVNGWYGSNTQIMPIGDYDQIRIKGSTSWQSGITLTDDDTELIFQLGNSTTGAFTAYETVKVKVDTEAPVFSSYEIIDRVTGTPGDLYFPSMGETVSFGNYFNRMVNFNIKFQDTRSTPEYLYYSLSDSAKDSGGSWTAIKFAGLNSNTGIATATIEIPAALVNSAFYIHFYAVDMAGNESGSMILGRDGESGPNEWAVQDGGPVITDWVVKSGQYSEITVQNGSDEYYSNCVARLSAEDMVSGIYDIIWNVNGEEITEGPFRYTKTTQKDFELKINQKDFPKDDSVPGRFTVSAKVRNSAGVSSEVTEPFVFFVDDEVPIVNITSNYDVYQQEVKLEFNAYDELSGIKYINVKNQNGDVVPFKIERVAENDKGYKTSYCYVEISTKGDYIIEVSDNAGNIFTETIVLDKVSKEVPPCPEVTMESEVNADGWITDQDAKVVITNVTETLIDKTAVVTKYQMWKDGEDSSVITELSENEVSREVPLQDGVYKMRVWSESKTGILCREAEEDSHVYTFRVDTEIPDIVIESAQSKDNSNPEVVFQVNDSISGVDADSINVFCNGTSVPIKSKPVAYENEKVTKYQCSFDADRIAEYTIQAGDIAGNEAEEEAFTKMSMHLMAVKEIFATSANVGARVYTGSADSITSAEISYHKVGDKDYQGVVEQKVSISDGLSVSAVLGDSSAGTQPLEPETSYIYRVTAKSSLGQSLVTYGYFKTLSEDDKTEAKVTGRVYYNAPDQIPENGLVTVGLFSGAECVAAQQVQVGIDFEFDNVPDGTYNLKADDGLRTRSVGVVVQDGKNVDVTLTMSSLSTNVLIDPDVEERWGEDVWKNVSVDGLDAIFEEAGLYGNYNADDRKWIDRGGNVTFVMHISMKEATPGEWAFINNKMVGAWMDLTIKKVWIDSKGNEIRSFSIHNLEKPITVTIPLGDLADETGLDVIRIHDNQAKSVYVKMDGSNCIIESNQFSTYAVLYDSKEEPSTENPSTENPSTENPSTQTPPDKNPSTESPSTRNPATTQTNTNHTGGSSDGDGTNSGGGSTDGSSVVSLRSSGSAKTGDEAPVAVMGTLMLLALGGFFVLRRKVK